MATDAVVAWPREEPASRLLPGPVAFGVVVVLGLVVAAMSMALAAGWRLMVVESDSMGSVVPKGSVAVVAPEPAALIVVGDVLAFRPPPDRRGNIMGRVVDIRRTEDGFFFQTADVSTDVPHRLLASEEDVIGTYRLHVPHVGAVVEAISGPFGLVALVVLPAALLVAVEIRRRLDGD